MTSPVDILNAFLNSHECGAQCVGMNVRSDGQDIVSGECQIDSPGGSVDVTFVCSPSEGEVYKFVVTEQSTAMPVAFNQTGKILDLGDFSPIVNEGVWEDLIPDMDSTGVCEAVADYMRTLGGGWSAGGGDDE